MKKKLLLISLVAGLAILIGLMGCSHSIGRRRKIFGVKIFGYTGDLDKIFSEWRELGINTVFIVSDKLISDKRFHRKARKYKIDVFITARVFFNDENMKVYMEKNPEAYAVTARGEKAEEGWLKFICPSREDYRRECIEKFSGYVKKYRPTGLSLDFIRHFVYWEGVAPDARPEDLSQTCFCDHCLKRFGKETGITINPEIKETSEKADWILSHCKEQFILWKCETISSWVKDIVMAVKEIDPGLTIHIFTVPWLKDDYDNGIRRVAGQDYKQLSEFVDVLTPMSYSNLIGRDPEWIEDLTDEITDQCDCRVVPAVQINAIDKSKEKDFSTEVFSKILNHALSENSDGLMLFAPNWENLSSEREKKEILKEFLL